MTPNLIRQRHHSRKIRDRPPPWCSSTKIDHTPNNRNTKQVHPFKIPKNLIKSDPEALFLDFLRSSSPFHLDGEEMADQCCGEMEGDATEEENEHWCPFYCFDNAPEEDFFAEAVAEHGECEGGLGCISTLSSRIG
jgi:hypothetical protein